MARRKKLTPIIEFSASSGRGNPPFEWRSAPWGAEVVVLPDGGLGLVGPDDPEPIEGAADIAALIPEGIDRLDCWTKDVPEEYEDFLCDLALARPNTMVFDIDRWADGIHVCDRDPEVCRHSAGPEWSYVLDRHPEDELYGTSSMYDSWDSAGPMTHEYGVHEGQEFLICCSGGDRSVYRIDSREDYELYSDHPDEHTG